MALGLATVSLPINLVVRDDPILAAIVCSQMLCAGNVQFSAVKCRSCRDAMPLRLMRENVNGLSQPILRLMKGAIVFAKGSGR
jgi:hypothetical protein